MTSTSTTARSGPWPEGPREDVFTVARPGTPNGDGEDRRIWRRSLFLGLSALVVSRVCMLIGAGVRASQQSVDADRLLQPRPGSPFALVARVFAQWDSNWYLEIVRNGYPRSIPPDVTYFQLEARAAFFPLYPHLVRWFDAIVPAGDTFAALLLNVIAAVAAVVLVGLLARRLYGAEVAGRTMVLFAIFPGSFVLSFAYAEALLIVLAAACLLFLHDERWLLAGAAAALATATRPNGIALVAACIVASAIAIHRRRDWWSLVAVVLSPLGFLGFQWFLAAHTGESTAWWRVQSEAWREGTSFGITAVSNTLSFLRHPLASPADALTFACMITLGFGLWCLWKRRLPWPMVAYCAVIIALMLLPATVTARPRFLLTAFPLFISVAAWWPRNDRTAWDLMLVLSGAGLTGLTALYGVYGAIP